MTDGRPNSFCDRMRIIAGTYGGRRLKTLKGEALRPTSDQLRETLFSVLGESIRSATFLDMYAGSGAVGIEALSRGAREVVFVEHHRPAVDLIRENLRDSIRSATFLDMYAGSGAVGIEALSRGAREVVFVEHHRPAVDLIRENLRSLSIDSGFRI